ncbi:MAG: serine/threonine-protein phosphatase [Algicola sp.]|nr:serine/threonine-protein phosphatase [Algicola sp.]
MSELNTKISADFTWSVVSFTDTGKVRKINEDDFMANNAQAHWAVADGMGGHDAGDVASQAISKALYKIDQTAEFGVFVDRVEDCLIEVNQNLRTLAGGGDRVIGSTVAGLAIQQQYALYYWVGDSRVYRFRNKTLKQLSIDHTYTQELVDQGKISIAEVANHPDKNVITRAVGADEHLFVDFEIEKIKANDVYFICSDGVEKEMDDKQVEQILVEHQDNMADAGKIILDTVIAKGARDNVTFILVSLQQQ